MIHRFKAAPSYGGYTRGCRCPDCIQARRAHKKLYREANTEKVNAYQRAWYAANRAEFRQKQNAYRRSRPEETRAREAARYIRYREERKARARQWATKNRARKNAVNAAWYAANKDRVKENVRRWQADNPGRMSEMHHRRRAREAGAKGSHTAAEWEIILNLYERRCAHCGAGEVTKDHIVPLSRGGSNYASNLQPLCKPCNSRKGCRVA